MTPEALVSVINRIEDTLPVSEWRVHRVQLWPIVRGRITFSAFDQDVGDSRRRSGAAAGFWRRLRAVMYSLRPIARGIAAGSSPRVPADVVIVTDGIITARMDGQAFDVMGDPLRALAVSVGCTVATWYVSYACPEPRLTLGTLIQWRLDAAQFVRMLWRSNRPDGSASLTQYDAFRARLREAGLPDTAVSAERMARLALRVEAMAERLAVWLRASAARVVFVNCYYSLEGAALVLACKRCRVLCVDVQHGVQGRLNTAYGAWSAVPESGYELLPDRFWCWSQAEVEAIESWTSGRTARHSAVVGGNPWLDMWRDDQSPLVAAAERSLGSRVRADQRTVLVTLQWGMTDEIFLAPLIALMAAAGNTWVWMVRLHPVMVDQAGRIRALLHVSGLCDVLVDDSNQFALPALLRRADVHLTHSSSAALEAAAMGVGSVVTSPNGVDFFPQLAAAGVLCTVPSLASHIALPALEAMALRRSKPDTGAASLGAKTMATLLSLAGLPRGGGLR